MKKITVFICFFTLLTAVRTYAQWTPFGAGGTGLTATRTGLTGVGFTLSTDVDAATNFLPPSFTVPVARFVVQDGILAHFGGVGTIGNLSNSTWSGLGLGNPGGGTQPYGLSMTRAGSVGFLNLIPNVVPANGEDLIAGFGVGTGAAANRFILRAYNNTSTQPLDFKNLIIANPRGAFGINEEPFAAFSVDTRRAAGGGVLPGVPPLVDAIAIQGEQNYPPDALGIISTASAIGNQANTSLALSGVAVEGSRAQIPSFVPGNPAPNPLTLGVAVNLQAVFDPSGGPNSNAPSTTATTLQQREYAELTWQDLDYLDNTNTDCNNQALTDANKFYISFRNGRTGTVGGVIDPVNGNSFSVNNKRPVMTFLANGRVGINNTNPACQIGGLPVFLDVNGWINTTNGTLISSDRRFKKDIRPIEGAMDKIRRLQGTTYTLRTEEFPERAFGEGRQYGFIAQDLERVIPELTGTNSDGYYAVNYTALIPVLAEAVKEQDAVIAQQKAVIATQADEIARLNAEMQQLRNLVLEMKSAQSPADLRGYRLEQNTPNPFGNTTQIRYALPARTAGASINVYAAIFGLEACVLIGS